MNKKRITIITGTGGHLGTGHFQRMCALADHLNRTQDFLSQIFIASGNPEVPVPIKEYITGSIPEKTSLIIRDMRDSSSGEINNLRRTAPVLAIDDNGPGRSSADYILDILPSPVTVQVPGNMFLYGYNFISSIRAMNLREFSKDIDVAIYTGHEPDMKVVKSLQKDLPGNTSAVLFARGVPSIISGNIVPAPEGYVDTLLRSKILVTYFGITMFEGDLTGCRIITVNPSHYHSELTRLIQDTLNVVPAGEFTCIDHKAISDELNNNMHRIGLQIVSSRSIKERININLDYFVRHLEKITG